MLLTTNGLFLYERKCSFLLFFSSFFLSFTLYTTAINRIWKFERNAPWGKTTDVVRRLGQRFLIRYRVTSIERVSRFISLFSSPRVIPARRRDAVSRGRTAEMKFRDGARSSIHMLVTRAVHTPARSSLLALSSLEPDRYINRASRENVRSSSISKGERASRLRIGGRAATPGPGTKEISQSV